MKSTLLTVALAGLTLAAGCSKDQPAKQPASTTTKPATAPATPAAPAKTDAKPADAPILSLTVKDIDGKDVPLSQYAGKVLLVVNVASKCGNTPQYAALEKLYESRKDKGLVILGFPANDFGKQEPGSEADIKTFCTDNYHVTFPMFSKVVVKGDGKCELYKLLAAAKPAAPRSPSASPSGTSPNTSSTARARSSHASRRRCRPKRTRSPRRSTPPSPRPSNRRGRVTAPQTAQSAHAGAATKNPRTSRGFVHSYGCATLSGGCRRRCRSLGTA
ncbi:MAG: glutathione peroxidase [Phycisphaerales bacterium]